MSDTATNPKIIVKTATVLILFVGYWLCCAALGLLFSTILLMIQIPPVAHSSGIFRVISFIFILALLGSPIIYIGTRMWQRWPIVLTVIAFIFSLSGLGSSILMYLHRINISGQSNQIQWTALAEAFLILGIINLMIGITLLLLTRKIKAHI